MEIVPIGLARKLKEKGFREPCTHFYRNETFTPQEMFCGLRSNAHHKWSFNSMELKLKDTHERILVNIVDAPTISQVLKWLREEKRWVIVVRLYSTNEWYWFIQDEKGELKSSYLASCNDCFPTYELAALAGIEHVIDNLI